MRYGNKFGARKTGAHASRKEARRAAELKLLERVGMISDLREQVPYEVVPKQDGERAVTYIADFAYVENGKQVVEDVKSEITRKLPTYIIKRKLMLHVHGIRIRET